MTRVALTGATGFVGRRLMSQLVAGGYEVRALARYSSDLSGLDASLEIVRGDVRSAYPVGQLLLDCDSVVHLAGGHTTTNGLADIVACGTENVIELAREAGVQRIVFMGCLGANAASESPFYTAKWKAETLVRASELTWTILQPSVVLGRGDGIIRPLASIVRTLPVIPVPDSGTRRFQPIDVDDLCRCIVRSLANDTFDKQTVAIGGPDFVTLRQLVDLVSKQLGVSKMRVFVPDRAISLVSRIVPRSGRPLFADGRLAQFRQDVVVSPGIVKRMFGFEAGSVLPRIGEYLA